MKKFRQKQTRSLGFESLEGRLTMSTGLAGASLHAHAHIMKQIQRTIPFTFRGHTSISGSTQTIPDLAGKIGNVRFKGTGSVTIGGTQVLGGDAYLTSRQGSLHLQFGSSSITQVGRRQRQQVPFTIVGATGLYSPYVGTTGMGTAWSVPANPKQLSTFSGFINNPLVR
jgi:hypothetical protein